MKRTQNLKILDLLAQDGFITTRRVMQKCNVNQPFARIGEVRRIIDLHEIPAKRGNTRLKIWHLPRKKGAALRYMASNGLEAA